jgi:N-sulfoglucosamine sulfohydrolase
MKHPSAVIRRFLYLLLLLFGVQNASAAPRPNVVLYVCDDWGRDAGCFGNPILKTPNIDQLAREGTRFERAYCTTASCSASRSVILTGLHNHLNGQYGHQHDVHHFSALPSVDHCLSCSWRAAIAQHASEVPRRAEEVFKFESVFQANSRNGIAMAEACRDWFSAKDDRPFFLYICTSDPHRGGGKVAANPANPDSFGNNETYKRDQRGSL